MLAAQGAASLPSGLPAAELGAAAPSDAAWLGSRPRPVLLGGTCAVAALTVGFLAPTHLKDAVGVVVLAGLVGAVLLRPFVGAIVLVGLVPITSGLAAVSHVRLSEAVIGVVGATLLLSTRRRDAASWRQLDVWLAAYAVAWALFGVLGERLYAEHLAFAQWGTVAGQIQFFLVYRGVRVSVRNEVERRSAIGVLILSSSLVSLLAVLQKLGAPGVRGFLARITGGSTAAATTGAVLAGHGLRATGPFANWAALAGYLLPILLVLVALALAGTPTRYRRWFVATGVLAAAGLALTEEQSVIICLLVGVVVLARQYGRGRTVVRWAPVLFVVLAVVAGPSIVHRIGHELAPAAGTGRVSWVPQTVSFRWSVWTKQYLPAVGLHPLTGYGVVLPPTIQWPYPESQYIAFLIEGGIPMLLMFVGLVWAMLRGTAEAARSADPFDRALGRALTIAIVSMLVTNTMWPFLSNGGMPQVLWCLLALAVPRSPVRRPADVVSAPSGRPGHLDLVPGGEAS